jgi:hypothetical protein
LNFADAVVWVVDAIALANGNKFLPGRGFWLNEE